MSKVPTNFEDIPEIIRRLEMVTGFHVSCEVNDSGSVFFQRYGRIYRKTLFKVRPDQNVIVEYNRWLVENDYN